MAEQCDIPSILPTRLEMLEGLTGAQTVLLSAGIGLASGICVLGLVQLYYCWTYVSDERVKNKLYVLVALFRTLAMFALCGMSMPRTQELLNHIGTLMIMYAIYSITSLGRTIYKTRDEFSKELFAEDKLIVMQSQPCCCCCGFLPKLKPTVSNLLRMERYVLQAVVLRAVAVTVSCIIEAENRTETKMLEYVDLACIPSLLFAVYGAHVMSKVSTKYLESYRISVIFRIVDISLPLYNAQFPVIFKLIVMNLTSFECGPLLIPEENAKYVFFFVILVEYFLLSTLATIMITPEKSSFFDLHPANRRLPVASTELDFIKDDPPCLA